MKPEIMIVKLKSGGWALKITTYQLDSPPMYNTYLFGRLSEALQAACVLKVHVDNDNVLPIKQYKRGA